MITVPNVYLVDADGQVWQLGASGVGAYTTTPVSGPTGLSGIVLTDLASNLPRLLTVLPDGALENAATTTQTAQQNIPVIATSGALMGIVILNSAVTVIRLCDEPIVGTFFHPPGYLPPFTQPGGLGTQTFPQQDSGSLATSQWILGCGHGVGSFEIQSASDCKGNQVAALLCPLCHFCVRVFSPFQSIYSYPNEVLFP